MRKLVFLRARDRGDFPEYSIRALERALSRAGIPDLPNEPLGAITLAGKVLSRAALIRQLTLQPQYAFFVPLMGPTERRFWPVSYFFEVIPYCYDCWPPAYAWWEAIFKRNKVRLAFFSAGQSAQYFATRMPQMETMWLPEATDSAAYYSEKPLAERSIDVLEMGRRYAAYHDRIRLPLQQAGAIHLFELVPGRVVFPTHREFLAGLADTKVSICFPSSVTHPHRSGHVETLTHRYLESIASKCVVVGRCIQELEILFGYNPVIEVDMAEPVGQLKSLLANIAAYQEAVDRNHRRLLEVGTWDKRVATLLTTLEKRGYSVGNNAASRSAVLNPPTC